MKMKRTLRQLGLLSLTILTVGHTFFGSTDRNTKSLESSVVGNWQGTLDAGSIKLRLVLKVTSSDGVLTGTLDSLDQRRLDMPISSITQNGAVIRFELKNPNAVFEGTLSSDGQEIPGEWKQGAAVLPLVFKRTEKPATFSRPQEPKRPYPYAEEDITYENTKDKVTLAGTLTLPRDQQQVPAVLLITGSGSQDRDETVMGHKPFLVLADHLTRHGIAVLRVDDRGVGGSSKGKPSDTSDNYADDALAGVEFLKNRTEIDPRRIGLIGHSEGATVATIAAVRSKDVAFVAMMAGSGLPGYEVLDTRISRLMKANGADDKLIDQTRRLQNLLTDYQKIRNPSAKDAGKVRVEGEKIISKMPDAQKDRMTENLRLMLTQPEWYRYFVTYDPRPNLKKLRVPVLAVIGDNDLQVPSRSNLYAIAKALKAGGNKRSTTVELPRLNHHFQTSKTGSPNEYGEIEETISPTVLTIVSDWIKQLKP